MADFPNIEPDSEEIALIANNQVYNSPLTGQAQTASLTGAKWQCTPTFSNRNGKEARDLRAFLFDQEGVSGRFNYYPASIDNIGTHAGGGVVDGTGQTGKSLLTKGWDADQPLLFAAGDYLTVNGEMKMVTADVGTTGDRIEYDETNYMPSPFDPSGWYGATTDPDLSYTSVTESNPSGESFVGEFEQVGTGAAWTLSTDFNTAMNNGEYAYFAIIFKEIIGIDSIRCYFQYSDGGTETDGAPIIKLSDGSGSLPTGWSTKVTSLIYGYSLLEVKMLANYSFSYRSVIYLQRGSGTPELGDKIKLQAAFFGKASDWPAKLRANATIPITPAIRVSPSDENAIEVENPYFPARLDTDDMSRLQVSAPVIYNTTLSIVEDF